ncbi:phage protein NinX family protein [Pseudomonas alliivorans]|nr:phage protein NinX family protein [Pseudomonas alliivorans]
MSEFVEVKTADLVGAALDWAVAKVAGVELALVGAHPHIVVDGRLLGNYRPSTSWNQGGPLIETRAVTLTPFAINFGGAPSYWLAQPWDERCLPVDGPTPLVAACRAIVASVLGETVSVPKELLS